MAAGKSSAFNDYDENRFDYSIDCTHSPYSKLNFFSMVLMRDGKGFENKFYLDTTKFYKNKVTPSFRQRYTIWTW